MAVFTTAPVRLAWQPLLASVAIALPPLVSCTVPAARSRSTRQAWPWRRASSTCSVGPTSPCWWTDARRATSAKGSRSKCLARVGRWPVERAHERGAGHWPGRPEIRRGLDDAGRVPRSPAAKRRVAECGVVRRRDHRAHSRDWLCRSGTDTRGARSHEGARAPGDARRRAWSRLIPYLCSGVLCEDSRARGIVQGGRRVWRHVHLAPPQ